MLSDVERGQKWLSKTSIHNIRLSFSPQLRLGEVEVSLAGAITSGWIVKTRPLTLKLYLLFFFLFFLIIIISFIY